MKHILHLILSLILVVPPALLAGFIAWAAMTYTIVETARGGEWMVLKSTQANECATSGGCAVFSGRELAHLFAWLMMEQRKAPTL